MSIPWTFLAKVRAFETGVRSEKIHGSDFSTVPGPDPRADMRQEQPVDHL